MEDFFMKRLQDEERRDPERYAELERSFPPRRSESPRPRKRRSEVGLWDLGRGEVGESSATAGGKTKGRPPAAASGGQAGRPQLGRNPEASTSPNKPGRPPKGTLSKAEERRRSMAAEQRVADDTFARMAAERPRLPPRPRTPEEGEGFGSRRSQLVAFVASTIAKLTETRVARVGGPEVINLLSRAGRLHSEDVRALVEENATLRMLLTEHNPDVARGALMSSPGRPGTSATALDSRRDYSLSLQRFGLMHLNEEGPISANIHLIVTLPPNFVYDILLRAATHVSTDGTGCWLQDEKDTTGFPGSHQRYHVRVKHPKTNATVRGNPLRHQLAAVAAGWGPCMLRTYRSHVAEGEEQDILGVHVSHLCHTAECFNPRHMVIEYPADNWARNLCRNMVVAHIRWPNGSSTKIDPCEHGSSLKNRLQCILPTVRLDGQAADLPTGYINAPLLRRQRPKLRAPGPAYGGFSGPDKRYLLSAEHSDNVMSWCEHMLKRDPEAAAMYAVRLP